MNKKTRLNFDDTIQTSLEQISKLEIINNVNDSNIIQVNEEICIHQLVEIQVAKTPDAVAVIFEDRQLTYRELNQKANQLAHYLIQLGVKPEVLVGVCVERSLEMVIALLAILKAGGAYVPLDPAYPPERLASIAEDAEFSVLLTQKHLTELLPQHQAQTVYLDSSWEIFIKQSTDNLVTETQPHNLAYVLYTSGSTGKPKGVAIEHRNTVALINWATEFFTFEQLQGVLASTSLCFDLSVFEIFVTLSCGGKVILAQNALQLPKLIAASEVTLINTVPSAIATLYRINGIPESVNTINLAGEPLQNALVQQLYQLDRVKQVVNLYGPTEDTTYSTVAVIPKGWNDIPLIGRPIANTQIYLLEPTANGNNNLLKTVEIGKPGEIYISGTGLARGYLNRPELTAEKFISNPFSSNPESRLYKTGDLAVYLPDGNLKFLGRIDHQVKVRGFRIELGEIESVLSKHPAINQVFMMAREAGTNDKQLVAYLVPKLLSESCQKNIITRELRSFLQQQLPDYMIPKAFILLEELPLNPNGKIDRRALPIPKWSLTEEGDYTAPRTPLETQIAKIWSQLLRIKQISIHDSFYELGGHSLLVIRLFHQIEEVFQIKLSLECFLESPTIEYLAQTINALSQAETIPSPAKNFEKEVNLDHTIYPENILSEPIPQIFLTGVTGFLGASLLYELLQQTRADVHCLVRATSIEEGRVRIKISLKRYLLWEESLGNRIFPVLGDLSKPHLGTKTEEFSRLAEKIDIIYHCGAWVNVVYPYSALKATNVLGTQEVLRLASQIKIKPVHFISTVDVFPSLDSSEIQSIREENTIGPGAYLYNGYAQSKYVAEQLVKIAHLRGLPVSIYRSSNIIGHTGKNIYQTNSFITMMLKGCLQMGIAPELEAMLNLVSVDYVSQAIVHLSRRQQPCGKAFHIVNPEPIEWKQLVYSIRQMGYSLELVAYETWYARLLKLAVHESDNLLTSIATIFANQNLIQQLLGAFYFNCENTLNELAINSIVCPPANDKFLDTYFAYLIKNGYFSSPSARDELKRLVATESNR